MHIIEKNKNKLRTKNCKAFEYLKMETSEEEEKRKYKLV